MDLTTQAHLAAGLLALGLAVATFARDPRRSRSRLLAALALALATWNLSAALRHSGLPGREIYRLLTYLGGATAGPVALHLALVLSGTIERRRRALAGAYLFALAGLVAAYSLRSQPGWMRIIALGLPLLMSFAMAAQVLVSRARSGEARADVRSLRVLLVLGAVAGILGLTDLLPRGDSGVPPFGPLALIPFLFALATLCLQRRYLELDSLVARVAAIALAALAASGLVQAFVGLLGPSPGTYFLASLVIVAVAGPLVASLLTGTRAILEGQAGDVARVLSEASESLARAEDEEGAWRAIEALSPRLPGDARIHLRLGAEAVAAGEALAMVLRQDRAPVTRRLLEIDVREAPDARRRTLAALALTDLDRLGLEIAAPLMRENELAGIAALGGGRPELYVRGEAGAALLALGHQALATLDRIRAQETARRKEALAVVGEMAASLAHDVRNPLGAIRGAAQVLAEARDPAQEREMLAVIDTETERLGRVLGEFLEWARPRPSRREPVDLGALARRVAAQVRLATAGGTLDVEVPGAPEILGDEELLGRALANLLRNAREAAGASGRVLLRVAELATGAVELRIEDDGPGIPASVRERLFEPFVTTKPGGTGLGLPLVQRVATDHGGTVAAEDRAPRGTVFTLVLPAAPRLTHDGGGGSR